MILRVFNVDWILGWVACLIEFISIFFPSWKTVLKQSWQLLDTSSTLGYLSSFQAFSYRNLNTSSTPGGSIEKVLVSSIASRHLVDQSSLISCAWCFCTSTLARHLYLSAANSLTPSSTPYSTPLDLSRSFCLHCFSHVLHISFILSSIASFFITCMHLYWFFVPPWSSLIIFIFLGWSFLASCTICQSWQKRGEIGKYVLSF